MTTKSMTCQPEGKRKMRRPKCKGQRENRDICSIIWSWAHGWPVTVTSQLGDHHKFTSILKMYQHFDLSAQTIPEQKGQFWWCLSHVMHHSVLLLLFVKHFDLYTFWPHIIHYTKTSPLTFCYVSSQATLNFVICRLIFWLLTPKPSIVQKWSH